MEISGHPIVLIWTVDPYGHDILRHSLLVQNVTEPKSRAWMLALLFAISVALANNIHYMLPSFLLFNKGTIIVFKS